MAISRKIKKEETKETAKAEKSLPRKQKFPKEEYSFRSCSAYYGKSDFLGGKNGYVFKVEPEFNKIMVRQAVKKQYNVEPKK